jgi:hypothetical protein
MTDTLSAMDAAARAAMLDALDPADRELVEAQLTGAAAAIEQRARVRTDEPAPTETPPNPAAADNRSAEQRLIDAVVASPAAVAAFHGKPFTPMPPAPPLTSPEIEAAKQLVDRLTARRDEAKALHAELISKGARLRMEIEVGGSKTARARKAQHSADRREAADAIEELELALLSAQEDLRQAIAAAEADRRNARVVELQQKWGRIIAANEKLDAALKLFNEGAHELLVEIRDLSAYRDLNVAMPTSELLTSRTRMSFAIAHAGDAAVKMLHSDHVPGPKREALADLARRGAAAVQRAPSNLPPATTRVEHYAVSVPAAGGVLKFRDSAKNDTTSDALPFAKVPEVSIVSGLHDGARVEIAAVTERQCHLKIIDARGEPIERYVGVRVTGPRS